jgi:cell division protein FtsB
VSETIQKVENFIQRLHNGEIIITPEARNIRYGPIRQYGLTPIFQRITKSLADYLSSTIWEYEQRKNDKQKNTLASHCLMWIDRAYAHGVVRESEALIDKLGKCEEQNTQLKERIDKLEKECQRLRQLNEALHETLDKFGKRDTNSFEGMTP